MSPGRNDRCPCGSGRKYKHCCADADSRRERGLSLMRGATHASGTVSAGAESAHHGAGNPLVAGLAEILRRSPLPMVWEVDALPVVARIGESPDARPSVVIVSAHGGAILHVDPVMHPPSEPEEVAKLLLQGITAAVRNVERAGAGSAWPREVMIRHATVAPPLARLVAGHGITVRPQHLLPTVDGTAASLQRFLGGQPAGELLTGEGGEGGAVLISSPDSWAGWGLPRELVADLFAAGARFHAARPWTHLYNSETLELTIPGEGHDSSRWTACVMGNGGQQFGLTLYADEVDFWRMVESEGGADGMRGLRDAVLTFDFEARSGIPRAMQREIAAAHWPVAGPDAYPRLFAMNTPAGGVSRRQARALTLALDAVAHFASEHASLLASHPVPEDPITWTDAATGVLVAYAGEAFADELGDGFDDAWGAAEPLAPGNASGPGADPHALSPALFQGPVTGPEEAREADAEVDAWREREYAVAGRFGAWLGEGGAGGRPLSESTQRENAEMARLFMDFLTGYQAVALAAVHEYDLRSFLYDWLPRKVRMGRTAAMRAPAMLRRFFRFVAEREGIRCPWADDILLDKEIFAERWDDFPGGFWWDEDVQLWRVELTRDLVARLMIPSPMLGDGEEWGDTMGPEESRLRMILHREWLSWRDGLVADEGADRVMMLQVLVDRQLAWQSTPDDRLGGRTPREVVLRERQSLPSLADRPL